MLNSFKKLTTLLGAVLLLFVLLPVSAAAHTHLISSDPIDGTTLTDQIEEIVLVFDSKVQQINEWTLQTEDEEEQIEIEMVKDPDDTVTVTLQSDLSDGQYVLAWDIVGEDGHLTNGTIHFTVEGVSEPESENEQDVDGDEDVNGDRDANEANADGHENDQETEEQPATGSHANNEQNVDDQNNDTVAAGESKTLLESLPGGAALLIIVVLIAVLVLVFFMLRKSDR